MAILELGQKRIDGAPTMLMQHLHGRVIELRGSGLRPLKTELEQWPEVLSVAQIGQSLRLLLRLALPELGWLTGRLPAGISAEVVRPSLEDVFVAHTGRAYAQSQ